MTRTLGDIAIMRAERGLATGGTGSGKSTLCEQLLLDFVERYPNSRTLIVDSKPRFRAQWHANGMSAAGLYRHWDHGPFIPDSVLAPMNQPPRQALSNIWRLRKYRIVIVQCENFAQRAAAIAYIDAFYKQARTKRPQLLYVDELLDFFHANAAAVARTREKTDAILRAIRAGRERGMGCLLGSQRPRGIPIQVVSELTKLYLFRLDFQADVKHLYDMGFPPRVFPPDRDREFLYWNKKRRDEPPRLMRLLLPEQRKEDKTA